MGFSSLNKVEKDKVGKSSDCARIRARSVLHYPIERRSMSSCLEIAGTPTHRRLPRQLRMLIYRGDCQIRPYNSLPAFYDIPSVPNSGSFRHHHFDLARGSSSLLCRGQPQYSVQFVDGLGNSLSLNGQTMGLSALLVTRLY